MPRSVPNYLSTDAQGRATAIFSGGVILPTPASGAYERGSAVTWTDGPGGAQLADITTFSQGTPGSPSGNVEFRAESYDPNNWSEINIQARGAGALAAAAIRLISGTNTGPSQSLVGGAVVKRSDGASDFIQAGGIFTGLGNIKVGFGQATFGVAAGWGTYGTTFGVPVQDSGVRLPFYSVVIGAGATLIATELPGGWPIVSGGNITGMNVDIDSSIAQTVALSCMCFTFH